MFSAKREFRNCIRLNYGHIWDERHAAAVATLGRLACAQSAGLDGCAA
jgi:DNA-binding transcriptional MocR family regulator